MPELSSGENALKPKSVVDISCVDVLVLAGGQGTRMRDVVATTETETTKILLPINSASGSIPMISNTLNGIHNAGPRAIHALTAEHAQAMPELVEDTIKRWSTGTDGSINVNLIREREPLGTGGAVNNALYEIDSVSSTIIVTPSDTLFPYNLMNSMLQSHLEAGAIATWAVTSDPGPDAQNSGRLLVDADTNRLEHALESEPDKSPEDLMHERTIFLTSVGVIALQTEEFIEAYLLASAFEDFPEKVDLYRDMMPWLLACDLTVSTFDIAQPAPDLGTPNRYGLFSPGELE